MSITKKDIAKYTLLPGFLPRIFALFSSGFGYTAYLIATIYRSLNLIEPTHPYLNPANMGRYGIRHVIAEASNNLVFSRKNIDQIIIFFTILAGVVVLLMQFVMLGVALFLEPALAQPALTVASFAQSINPPEQDLSFILLDRVFGLEGIFNSCVSQGIECQNTSGNSIGTSGPYPSAFHLALHSMLRFYSMGIFVIAVLVILYFVITITAETAATGTPFGQRFNKTWVPVRIVLFFALLIPLNTGEDQKNVGLNGAQIVTFWTAKFGSNFATNGWLFFNNTLSGGTTGSVAPQIQSEETVAMPTIPKVDGILQFIFTAITCKVTEERAYPDKHIRLKDGVGPYLVRRAKDRPAGTPADEKDYIPFIGTPYDAARDFFRNGTMSIVIGVIDPENPESNDYKGNVISYCGEIQIPVVAVDAPTATQESGAQALQREYYNLVVEMMSDANIYAYAQCLVDRKYPKQPVDPNCTLIIDKTLVQEGLTYWEDKVRTIVETTRDQQKLVSAITLDNLQGKGWAGASLWYNRIAEINGDFANAVSNMPVITQYPYVLELTNKIRTELEENVASGQGFNPELADGSAVNFVRPADEAIAKVMFEAFKAWTPTDSLEKNSILDVINYFFGTAGIFDMRKNNKDQIHPLAQLSGLGKSMMEASVRNIIIGFPTDKVLSNDDDNAKALAGAAGGFLLTIGKATLAMSFILYYVLPFLPFIYFIFAVSGWIKSIFEATVAMPLWALAHLKIDGEGVVGPAATNGYFLLFEIFMRPILILLGLIASITIFSAMVKVLNDGLFELMVSNVGGSDAIDPSLGLTDQITEYFRDPLDQFFFTVIYVVIVYLIGLSTFKLIDQIPNQILRWINVSTTTFQENAGDPAGELVSKTYRGALLATDQIKGGNLALIA